jgi:hypothetical protein
LNSRNNIFVKNYHLAFSTIFFLIIINIIWWQPNSIKNYNNLANRTNNYTFIKNYKSFNQISSFLSDYSKQNKKLLSVYIDPWLFVPRSNHHYQITEFWGPYTNWELFPDVVVFSSKIVKRINQPVELESVQHYDRLLESDGYIKYVIAINDTCFNKNCYRRERKLENGGEILVLISN